MPDEETTETSSTAPTTPTRRRRAAARPAGPPVESAAMIGTPPPPPDVPPAEDPELADEIADDTAPAEPAEVAAPAARRRRARKTAAPAEAELDAPDPDAPGPAEPEEAPATRTRRSRSRGASMAAQSAAPETSAAGDLPEPVEAPTVSARVPLFQAPVLTAAPPPPRTSRAAGGRSSAPDIADLEPFDSPFDASPTDAGDAPPSTSRRRSRRGGSPAAPPPAADVIDAAEETSDDLDETETESEYEPGDEPGTTSRRRRRRGGRGRRGRGGRIEDDPIEPAEGAAVEVAGDIEESESDSDTPAEAGGSRRRRRRRRRGEDGVVAVDDPENTVVRVRGTRPDADPAPVRTRAPRGDNDVASVRGSTRLEAKKQRRREGREAGRRRAPILSEAEFLARREAVDRVMVVRQGSERTQIAVLEDGVLVEHYVNNANASSLMGDIHLGRVQNVLPSMEAAFVDIGKGRNAVLYAGEVNFEGLEGQPKRIEHVLKSGQSVLVQVTKDPMGHKGARLTSQISLPGRYLVYVPENSMTGISRKLPDTERNRLKAILRQVVPPDAGVIVRTAAEGASEEELRGDVERLAAQWEVVRTKAKTATAPALLLGEPDLTIRVVRDVFNEDFTSLVVAGDAAWAEVSEYVAGVAPDLAGRLSRWTESTDVFAAHRVDEQILKALDRKVWLPSGGSLVIDRTEAMTVVDVNTGKFTGSGGNLEETVTRNNLEAAEEIVRQLRLRDIGGIIVIDFIDMVLESNRDLVLRRLVECLGRDRTKHQVAEVTSLGLVQMTRKRIGQGLVEAFSEPCEHCNARGIIVRTDEPSRNRVPKPSPWTVSARVGAPAPDAAVAVADSAESGPTGDGPAVPASRTGRRRRGRGGGEVTGGSSVVASADDPDAMLPLSSDAVVVHPRDGADPGPVAESIESIESVELVDPVHPADLEVEAEVVEDEVVEAVAERKPVRRSRSRKVDPATAEASV